MRDEVCSEVDVTDEVTSTFTPRLKTRLTALGYVPFPWDVFVTTSPGQGT